MASSFCSSITVVFSSLALAASSFSRTGFESSSWLSQQGWPLTGGDHAVAVLGEREGQSRH